MGMPNLSAAWSILSRGVALGVTAHGLHHVRCQHAIDEEARAALHDQRQLLDGGDEGDRLAHFLFPRLLAAHHLDQRKLRYGVEEMEPDEPSGIGKRPSDVLEPERGGVGGEHGARLHLCLKVLEELLLDLELLHDRLDHHVSVLDVFAVWIGDETRDGGVDRNLAAKPLLEQPLGAGERLLELSPRRDPAGSPACRTPRTRRRCLRPWCRRQRHARAWA